MNDDVQAGVAAGAFLVPDVDLRPGIVPNEENVKAWSTA
jgi:hypothetical protein